MAGRASMRLEEARTLLGVASTDDVDAVKSAYRKLAFSLHPDLHPDDPGAKRKFQRLNEAYLLLRHFYANRDDTPGAGPEKPQPGPEPTAGTKSQGKSRLFGRSLRPQDGTGPARTQRPADLYPGLAGQRRRRILFPPRGSAPGFAQRHLCPAGV
ncbi:MAG: DnaJ domain-containing protein [Solidesulfovibrio sp.]